MGCRLSFFSVANFRAEERLHNRVSSWSNSSHSITFTSSSRSPLLSFADELGPVSLSISNCLRDYARKVPTRRSKSLHSTFITPILKERGSDQKLSKTLTLADRIEKNSINWRWIDARSMRGIEVLRMKKLLRLIRFSQIFL